MKTHRFPLTRRESAPPRSRVVRGGGVAALHAFLAVVLILGLAGCKSGEPANKPTLRLLTGTENRDFADLFARFEKETGIDLAITYQGSVDTMLDLQAGAADYDAVWPASSIWLALGNTGKIVSRQTSIMTTPVVFAVKRSVAERLGWIGQAVTVEQILAAAESGQLRFMTSSATQSNSGAMAYLGYLYAFAGQPAVLTREMLSWPEVVAKTRRILGLVDRTAGASGYLRDLFLQQYDNFDGMVNNESAVINANLKLTAEGKEPLYVVYPVDGLAIADWPLAYVDHRDPAKADLFAKWERFLLSPAAQQEFLANGRRVGLGMSAAGANPSVFNPNWGIDLDRVIQPITLPPADVIYDALVLYQTALRKPSYTVYCLDFSGSMDGDGARDLKAAMRTLLDPAESARYLLQTAPDDVTIVMPFNDQVREEWRVVGNKPNELGLLLANITALDPGGGTGIYGCAIAALDAMRGVDLDVYAPAIILMTDGHSNRGTFSDLQARLASSPGVIPVYGILFGDASDGQLKQITEVTSGRLFDGRKDLIDAFRQAKGNN